MHQNQELPLKRWRNTRTWGRIDLSNLAVNALFQPLLLAAFVVMASWAISMLLGRPWNGRDAVASWIALQLIAIPGAFAAFLTRIHSEIVTIHRHVHERGYRLHGLDLAHSLYLSPQQEYLLIAVGSRIAYWLTILAAIAGGILLIQIVGAGGGSIAKAGIATSAVFVGAVVVGGPILAGGMVIVLAVGLVLSMSIFLSASPLLAAALPAAPLLTTILTVCLTALAIQRLVAFARLPAGNRSAKDDKGATGASYSYLAVVGGALRTAAFQGGGYFKTTRAIALATDRENLPGGSREWDELAPLVGRSGINSAALADVLEDEASL